MDKHILLLKKQTDGVSDEELRVNPESQRKKGVYCIVSPVFSRYQGNASMAEEQAL